MEESQKAREQEKEAFRKRFAPDAPVTTDANTKDHPMYQPPSVSLRSPACHPERQRRMTSGT